MCKHFKQNLMELRVPCNIWKVSGFEFNALSVAQHSPTELQNAIEGGKCFHSPLRGVNFVLTSTPRSFNESVTLHVATKWMNKTPRAQGLLPSVLVLGLIWLVSIKSKWLPKQQEYIAALSLTRFGTDSISEELKLSQAIQSKLPLTTKYNRASVMVF